MQTEKILSLYCKHLEQFNMLTNEELGCFIRAFYDYKINHIEPQLSGMPLMVFGFIKNTLLVNKNSLLKLAAINKQVSIKYTDGTFRQKRNGLEYRFMHNGKQASAYGRTIEECWKKRKSYDKNKLKKEAETLTFGNWLLQWFELYKKNQNCETWNIATKSHIDKKIIPAIGHINIKSLDSNRLQKFINSLSAMPNTQHKIAAMINAALRKAVDTRKIDFNPFNAVEYKLVKSKSYPSLQIAEQARLLEAIDNPIMHKICFFCCCTGMRIGEALAVKTADIDVKGGLITVDGVDTRTKKHYRQIPFLPELLDEFEALPADGLIFGEIRRDHITNTFQSYTKR